MHSSNKDQQKYLDVHCIKKYKYLSLTPSDLATCPEDVGKKISKEDSSLACCAYPYGTYSQHDSHTKMKILRASRKNVQFSNQCKIIDPCGSTSSTAVIIEDLEPCATNADQVQSAIETNTKSLNQLQMETVIKHPTPYQIGPLVRQTKSLKHSKPDNKLQSAAHQDEVRAAPAPGSQAGLDNSFRDTVCKLRLSGQMTAETILHWMRQAGIINERTISEQEARVTLQPFGNKLGINAFKELVTLLAHNSNQPVDDLQQKLSKAQPGFVSMVENGMDSIKKD